MTEYLFDDSYYYQPTKLLTMKDGAQQTYIHPQNTRTDKNYSPSKLKFRAVFIMASLKLSNPLLKR